MKKCFVALLGLVLSMSLTGCINSLEPIESSAADNSTQESSSSDESSSVHVHDYGTLIEEVLPSYYYDGQKAHYHCAGCQQFFDVNKNPVSGEDLTLPRSGDNLAISVNGVEKGTFTLLAKNENEVTWEYKSLVVAVDDVVTLTKPGDPTYRYKYFGHGNVDHNGKILTAGTVNLDLTATPNGFQLEVSGYKYQGLVVKINDEEYPLTKVAYYEDNKETYIYGYDLIHVGDVMTVVDNVNNVVYDYEDLENDTKWNTFDFHKGTNNEIVFDYEARYGIEFDRGGDKLISITKVFVPNDGSAFQVNYSSDKAAVDLEKMAIGPTHELYDEMSWYLNHQSVMNAYEIRQYVEANGFAIYNATISFAKNEMFNIKNVTKNSVIKGEHLASLYGESLEGLVSISGDYIKVLEDASITVVYAPFCDTISLYFSSSSGAADAYVYFNGSFNPVAINDNTIVYNNFHAGKYDSLSVVDKNYSGIEFTLATGYDATVFSCSTTSGMTLLMFLKAGTFSVSLNLTTHVLTATIIELDEPVSTGTPKYISGKGGLFKTLVDNPDNTDEVYASGVAISGTADGFYIAFYTENTESITDISLDSSSASYGSLMAGTMIYITQDGTYNIYIHKTTHVVRLVKTA